MEAAHLDATANSWCNRHSAGSLLSGPPGLPDKHLALSAAANLLAQRVQLVEVLAEADLPDAQLLDGLLIQEWHRLGG
jgi:hypothetical protein